MSLGMDELVAGGQSELRDIALLVAEESTEHDPVLLESFDQVVAASEYLLEPSDHSRMLGVKGIYHMHRIGHRHPNGHGHYICRTHRESRCLLLAVIAPGRSRHFPLFEGHNHRIDTRMTRLLLGRSRSRGREMDD